MAEAAPAEKKKFTPKTPVQLNPPRDDPISPAELLKRDGEHDGYPTYVAIKGTVFDVTGNSAYAPKGGYHLFAGKDASRALAKMKLEPQECTAEWEDLPEGEIKVLDDWFAFFEARYNKVGMVVRD